MTASLHKHPSLANRMKLLGEGNAQQGATVPDSFQLWMAACLLFVSALKHISLLQCTAANDLLGLVLQLLAGCYCEHSQLCGCSHSFKNAGDIQALSTYPQRRLWHLQVQFIMGKFREIVNATNFPNIINRAILGRTIINIQRKNIRFLKTPKFSQLKK